MFFSSFDGAKLLPQQPAHKTTINCFFYVETAKKKLKALIHKGFAQVSA
jgi:hypothetical protein